MRILPKGDHSSESAVVEIDFWCHLCCFSVWIGIVGFSISFSLISVKWGEETTDLSYLPCIWFRRILSHAPTSVRSVSFQTFDSAKDSTFRFQYSKFMPAILSSNKTLFRALLKETAGVVFLSNVNSRVFCCNYCHSWSRNNLPSL